MPELRSEFSDWERIGGVPDLFFVPDESVTEEVEQTEREKFRQREEILDERNQSKERPAPFATPPDNVGADEEDLPPSWNPDADPYDPRKQEQPQDQPAEQAAGERATAEQAPEPAETYTNQWSEETPVDEPATAESRTRQEARHNSGSHEQQDDTGESQQTQQEGTGEGAREDTNEQPKPEKEADENTTFKIVINPEMFKRVKDFAKDFKKTMDEMHEEARAEDKERAERREAEMKQAEEDARQQRLKEEEAKAAALAKETEEKALLLQKETEAKAAAEAKAAELKAAEEKAAAERAAAEAEEKRAAIQAAQDAVDQALNPTDPEIPVAPPQSPEVPAAPAETLEPVAAATQETPDLRETQTPEPFPSATPAAQTDASDYPRRAPDMPVSTPAATGATEPMTHAPATPPPVYHAPMPQPAAASAAPAEMPRSDTPGPEVYQRDNTGAWQRPDGGADNSHLNDNPYVGKSRAQVIGMLLNDRQGAATQTGGNHPPLQKPAFTTRVAPGARPAPGSTNRPAPNAAPGRTAPNAAPQAAGAETPRAAERPTGETRTGAPQERVTRETQGATYGPSPLADSTPIGRHGAGAHKTLRQELRQAVLVRTRGGLAVTIKSGLNVSALPTFTRSKITKVEEKEGKRFSYAVNYVRNGIQRTRTVHAFTPRMAKTVAKVQNVLGGII